MTDDQMRFLIEEIRKLRQAIERIAVAAEKAAHALAVKEHSGPQRSLPF